MSPEDRAREMLGIDEWTGRKKDLSDAIDAFAREMDIDPSEVADQVAERLLKAVQVARLRRLTGVYVEN